MMRLANAYRQQAAAQDGTGPANRWGTIQSVDTTNMTAKVLIQPENVLSGWLPINAPVAGPGWGVVCPPVVGQQVKIIPDAGDHESYSIAGSTWSKSNPPPSGSKSGELWLVHSTGASIKLLNTADDQKVMLALDAAGVRVTLLNTGHFVIVDPSGAKFEMTNNGTITLTGTLHVTGNVIAGFGGADQVALQTHRHGTGTAAAGTSVPSPGT